MRASFFTFLPLFASATALRVGLHGKPSPASRLQRRASIAGTTNVDDSSNIEYTTNITLGGNSFEVIIDTGSSDLYVTGDVPGAIDTGKTADVQYAIGEINGSIKTATLEFAGYTVQNQVYIDAPVSNTSAVGTGLIGLGPNSGSVIFSKIKNSSGDTPLDNIFRSNTSTPNFITILLQRDDDPGAVFPGELTVGEVLPGFENITKQPQLPVSQVAVNDAGNQHWQTLTDANGVIGPDGKAIDFKTGVKSTSNKAQLTAVFDSGFTFPQVPKAISDAIYENAPGAKFVKDSGLGAVWTLDCEVEINIAFVFGGIKFPVHPLDTVIDLNATDDDGSHICVGAFQPISTATSPDFDMVLGMGFLRNVYLFINFGDFVEGKLNQTADPYLQMLSTTNDTTAVHNDFVKVRGASKSVNNNPSFLDRVKSHKTVVIAICVNAGLLIIGAIVFCCLRNRKIRRSPAGFMNLQSSYQPLNEPAPAAYNMGPVGPPDGPPPPQHGTYNNPWDSHY
ncbi:acid protease [Trametopsis cervina]|nr:acid protease [Trametopsis cervina]